MSERRSTAYRAVLLAGALIVAGLLFKQLLTLLIAVLITVIIAIAISSFAGRLERRHVPRPIGALIGLLLGIAILAGLLALIIPPFVDQTNEFAEGVPGIVDDLRDQVHDITGAEPGDISDSIDSFVERYEDDPGKIIGPLTTIGLSAAGILGAFVLMLITAYYMAVRPEPLIDGLRRLVPPDHRPQADRIMSRLRGAWVGWMQGVAADMLISGVLLWIGLSLIGLDFAIFFAVLTALFSVIPYFGAFASGIPPVLFALTDSPGKAVLVIVVYVAVQQIEGNLTIPLVMARMVRLHPALIAGGVVVVGTLFGFVGLIVAVPILSMIVILVEELWVDPMEANHQKRLREPIDLPRLEEELEPERPTS
jgi:predicted PurR-regulated permease PerM